MTKAVHGVPIPEHLKEKYGIQPEDQDFVPVDPADKLIAAVAMKNKNKPHIRGQPSSKML